jgi:hypothetical protein
MCKGKTACAAGGYFVAGVLRFAPKSTAILRVAQDISDEARSGIRVTK